MRRHLGDRFERLEAVTPENVPLSVLTQFSQDLTPGEKGCYASHLLVARLILQRKLPFAVVLEDDVEFAADAIENIEDAIGRLRSWDIIGLSGAKQHPHRRVAALRTRSLVRFFRFPKVTAGYVMSASGARKLLRRRGRRRPIDVDIRYGWEMALDRYGIFPPPVRQVGGFGSSIPRDGTQRFYWRSDLSGYALGRASEAIAFLKSYLRPAVKATQK